MDMEFEVNLYGVIGEKQVKLEAAIARIQQLEQELGQARVTIDSLAARREDQPAANVVPIVVPEPATEAK